MIEVNLMKPFLLILVCLTVALPALGLPPGIDIAETSVTVSALTPGSGVALFAAGTVQKRLFPAGVDYSTVLLDSDGDGTVTFQVEKGVPSRSVWIAVDLVTGDYSVSAPEGYPVRLMQPPAKLVRKGNVGQMNRWVHELYRLNLLLVRPGTGAWAFLATKGGYGDDEKTQAPGFSTSLKYFLPLTQDAPALHNFRRGDVVVAIDPINLEYYALTLGDVEE
jgi:hypothetical protein